MYTCAIFLYVHVPPIQKRATAWMKKMCDKFYRVFVWPGKLKTRPGMAWRGVTSMMRCCWMRLISAVDLLCLTTFRHADPF